jgi:hypothetical protein
VPLADHVANKGSAMQFHVEPSMQLERHRERAAFCPIALPLLSSKIKGGPWGETLPFGPPALRLDRGEFRIVQVVPNRRGSSCAIEFLHRLVARYITCYRGRLGGRSF